MSKNEWDFVFRGEHPEYYGSNALKERPKVSNYKRPVKCLTDGREYTSIRQASAAYGITSDAIRFHLKDRGKFPYATERKLQFEYL